MKLRTLFLIPILTGCSLFIEDPTPALKSNFIMTAITEDLADSFIAFLDKVIPPQGQEEVWRQNKSLLIAKINEEREKFNEVSLVQKEWLGTLGQVDWKDVLEQYILYEASRNR